MTKNIYALLVGIDAYTHPIPPLQGCVNDIKAIEEYLEGRVDRGDYQLHLRTLLDRDATRQGIIEGFREHLSQATSDDIALFYYAGHGSQEQAPPEFWDVEPDRLNETIVCYDSRIQGGWDLADKELGKLISEVVQNNPHTVIIMDCCHSGSGTRGELDLDVATRKAPLDKRQRPLDSFIVAPSEVKVSKTRSLSANSNWMFGKGEYIFLSACRDRELAKEYNANGEKRGVFSYFLVDTLKKANGNLTYRDLFKRTDALVRSKVTDQSPQIEAKDSGNLERSFLGRAIFTHPPYFTVSHQPNYGWVIDGGAVHGFLGRGDKGTGRQRVLKDTPSDNWENVETTELAIFPFETPVAELSQPDKAIATAQVLKVMPQLSQIEVENLDSATSYKAIVTSVPLLPKGVLITGDNPGVELARQVLQQQSSLYITEADKPEDAEWQVIARDRQYIITRPVDDRSLVAPIIEYTEANASQVIQRLEHLTRWTNIAELSSSATSRIPTDAVKMSVYQDGKELVDTDLRLSYYQENGKWQQPTFKVKLTNNSNLDLYCALLDLSDRYEVSAELLATGGVWLQSGESAWALDGQKIYATVDKKLWDRGITETKDILKLIVSTAEFDATLLELNELDLPTRAIASPKRGKGTLNRLMSRVQTRAFSSQAETEVVYDDWMTSQVHITTVRPQDTVAIPQGNESRSLGVGVTIQPHPVKAKARLTTVKQATRDLHTKLVPPILTEDINSVQPFQFTTSRGNEPSLNVLELTEVQNPEIVSKQQPLKLIVDTPLADNEELLPIAYDGEFYLPLGWGKSIAGGKTEINLTRLPAVNDSETTRSLGGSFRILFQKIVGQKFKREYKYPLLAVADVDANETVTYIQDTQEVKAKVAEANNIILYIHGIIGDTEKMLPSVRRTEVAIENQSKQIADFYDVVLTFDYENLHTSIEENARLLKQKLERVGLGANHGKNLHIVAHSMGGLVSRWFIEREGGKAIAQHLIMLGTPNAGTPWSTVEDWAITMLGIGLNSLSTVSWSVPVLGMLMKAIGTAASTLEVIDVSLDQMKPGSQFLSNLASSPDPGTPYSIVAGNTSIIPAALESQRNKPSLIKRLTQKLSDRAISLAFFGQPNDIAVEVDSIKSVESNRIYPPQIQEVACDHMVYFCHPEGLKGLADAIQQAWQADSRNLVTATKINNPLVRETINKFRSPWLINIIAGTIAIATGIGTFIYWQYQPIQPTEQSQQSTAN
ncbi:caspase family protein [Myxosarcina sp. GI1]|uniref:caspase family protein n=1 Tax=Myxosarcina sp. GI1 TaxID=1541065 RepID=UPI000560EAFB|nr:caspase family protein [Myxosarcina sp. GI1]